ncbi:MAG TPA: C25 family cysteine peptidase, partial [Myxococcota bacterium]|nr:C25 family cysteine peptidase [Myxococcota bacterium]
MRTAAFLTTLVGTLILTGAQSEADELRLPVAFDAPFTMESPAGKSLAVPGAVLHAGPGAPLLPQKTVYFLLPYGHKPASLRLSDQKTEPLAGVFFLAPAQLPRPIPSVGKPRLTPPDPAVYNSDEPQPGAWARLGQVQYKRGYALVPVTVFPLSYRPLSGRVDRLVSATLVLTTKPGGRVAPLLRARASDIESLEARAADFSALYTYPQKPPRGPVRLDPGSYSYLIVAPEQFIGLGGEDSLEALGAVREAGGLPATIVSLEWIYQNYLGDRPDGGQDDATRIRDFLTDAFMEWGVSYALLVGDADEADVGGESGDNILPVRKLFVDTHNPDAAADYLPSDLYYGCLDGTFDDDADGVYGEHGDGPDGGEVDLMAELYVGRAPADSAEEVRNFVKKTLAYNQAAGSWLKNILMVGELLWSDPANVWGADFMDEIAQGSSSSGYTTQGFASLPFFEISTLYDRDLGGDGSWDATDLAALLDNGTHVVNHLGHSNVTYNMRMMNADVDGLVNANPFLLYTQGCLPGAFDNVADVEEGGFVYSADCIAEHFVMGPHGAFAAVVNSRYGWGSFQTDSPSQRFHRQFFDAFFGEGIATLGQAQADSKEDNAALFSDDYTRWVGFESNLLGDPAVVLKKNLNTDQPLLGVYPPEIQFVALDGDPAPAPVVVHVRNDGLDTLSFTASCADSWVTITTASGSAPADIEIGVDPAGLDPGNYQAAVAFESPEAANSPQQLTVELELVEVSEMVVPHIDTAPVVDGVISPGEYDQGLELPIDPEQNGDVSLHMAVYGNSLYVAVYDMVDREENESDRLNFYFDRDLDGQWPASSGNEGYYSLSGRSGGSLQFMPAFNPGDGYQTDRHNRLRDPAGFTGSIGMVDNHRAYEIAIDLNQSLLDVGPVGSFGMYLQVMNSVQMSSGNTTGSWPAEMIELDDQRFFGRVSLEPDGPWMAADPRILTFEAVPGRPAPGPASIQLFDFQGGSLDYSASVTASWLALDHASGQTPDNLVVSVDHDALELGTYEGEIVIESAGAGNGDFRVPVTLNVVPPPALLAVDPQAFDITASLDAPDPTLVLSVQNTGGHPLTFEVTPDQAWLVAGTAAGSMDPGESSLVQIEVKMFGMSLGTHTANILVDAGDAENSPITVPVQIEVVGAAPVPPVESLFLEAFDDR